MTPWYSDAVVFRTVAAILALLLAGCAGGDATDRAPTSTGEQFALPWTPGERWFLVGGPHCDSPSEDCGEQPRYALDFAPIAPIYGDACRPGSLEPYWVTAAGPGIVRVAGQSLVEIEHEDGRRSGYYHLLSSSMQVTAGDAVGMGDHLGHPSCEHLRGGASRGLHVHFYFCEAPAGDDACLGDASAAAAIEGLTLSGWRVVEADTNYEGRLEREGERRTAVNLRCDGSDAASAECGERRNDIASD
ncbi:MAG TPA: M23 family metallopeptidase [Dehalococcoidia bacterium]|nr:M23 family metallopeptidase [Dehalococcoidia bacterium]